MPEQVEHVFSKGIVPIGAHAIDEGFGYTPWFEVNLFGVDPYTGFYSVELCGDISSGSNGNGGSGTDGGGGGGVG